MNQAELNSLTEAYNNVDGMTLHTDDPGNTGANDAGLGTESLTWSSAIGGVMSATASFTDVPAGTYPYAGLWDDDVFIEGVPLTLVVVDPIPVHVTVEHHAKART